MASAPVYSIICKINVLQKQYVLDTLIFQLNPNSRFLMQNTKDVKTNQMEAILNYNKFMKDLSYNHCKGSDFSNI